MRGNSDEFADRWDVLGAIVVVLGILLLFAYLSWG